MDDFIEEIALKPSLRSENHMKSISNRFDDVFYCFSTVDDFAIDDLLDFSNGDDFNEREELFRGSENDGVDDSVKFSGFDDFHMVPASEFSLPIDDLENLEWVSRVVNDSGLENPVIPVGGSYKAGSGKNWCKPGSKQGLSLKLLCFPSTIPAKPRTKRSRPVGRVWSLESPSLSESLSSPTRSELSSPTSCLVEKPRVKKRKKNPVLKLVETGSPPSQRRCSHCQVQKTPQWRTGPLGAKTLCNACGVRFKSGRLYPEYRPACSPTFSRNVHSNSHRKVLEMRRNKETGEPELNQTI